MSLFLFLFFIILEATLFSTGHAGFGIDDVGDYAEDAIDDGTDFVEDTWNDVSESVTEAAADTVDFFEELSDSVDVASVISSIEEAANLAIDYIEDAVASFNITTWVKLAEGAKLVIYNLAEHIQEYIAIGCNFLEKLLGLEVIPFPLDVLKDDDFYTVAECVGDSVFSLAVDWTEEVAATYVEIIGNGDIDTAQLLDFAPLLNIETIEKDLNYTYQCLYDLGADMNTRDRDDDDINLISEITDYFDYDDMAITLEISLTVCTLSCARVGLGFAVSSTNIRLSKPFYSVSMGIDTSSVVGGSVGITLGFATNFSDIAGSAHSISFGGGIDIPLLPDVDFPDVAIDMSASEGSEGDFAGFSLTSSILDVSYGLNGAFSLGYSFSQTEWLYTTNDLKKAWDVVSPSATDDIDSNDISDKQKSFNVLTTEVLDAGGFFLKSKYNDINQLWCPSTSSAYDYTHGKTLSLLDLGYININEVIYGNIEGDNNCNCSNGYSIVNTLCEYESSCSFDTNSYIFNDNDDECLNNLIEDDIYLSLIYECPDTLDVYNLGCYSTDFYAVVDNGWVQDYNNDELDDGWELRTNKIAKCAKIAKDNNYDGFALWNNGMCLIASDLLNEGVYNENSNKLNSTYCASDGYGNDISMNLYSFTIDILAYSDLGCLNFTTINDYNEQAGIDLNNGMETFEDEHYLFKDEYKKRNNAITKCATVANKNGYNGFGLLDGGKCYFNNEFTEENMNNIKKMYNTNNTRSCGGSRGTDFGYNVFTFPYAELDRETTSNESGLTTGEIAVIVIVPLVLILIFVIVCIIFCKKCRNKGNTDDNYKQQNNDYKAPAMQLN